MMLKGNTDGTLEWSLGNRALNVSWAMRTDLGRRREINEDSAAATPPIFAVADGMGGHDAGEVASACVVERLSELADREVTESEIVTALRGAVADLVGSGVDSGSGTTVTGLSLSSAGHMAEIFNIGDSRVYLYRDQAISQLTVDHSVVQELIDSGHISVDEAEVHPHANVITRAVGFHDDPVPDFIQLTVEPGDRILICTDGLTKEITTYGLGHFVGLDGGPSVAAEAMLEAALENGGRDNITVIVLHIDE
ncbi:MAG: PP2C family protein-serine/threonine phosphatase [Agromyces sp.]